MYTDQSRVEAYLKRSLTDDEVAYFDDIVTYLSSMIDSYTGRTWSSLDATDEEEVEATERIYDGGGSKELFVDDFTALDSIELLDRNGGTISNLVTDTEWMLYPNNATRYQSLRLRNYYFPYGSANVKITAVWGSGDVPIDIVMVCTALVGNYFTSMGDTGKFSKESIEGYSYELKSNNTDSQTQSLLKTIDRWRKITL